MSSSKAAYFVSGLLFFCSCNNAFDEEPLEKEVPVPIEFSLIESSISTRAPVTTIDASNVSSMGIFGVQEGNTSGQYPWTASPFASNIVPSGINSGQLSFSPKLYYPLGGKRLKFYAYYPSTTNTNSTANSYITLSGNGTAPVYNFTLSDQQDIMFAASIPMSSNSGTPVTFQYTHQLCQVIVDIGLLSGTLGGIKLLAVPIKGAMNLGTGVITWSSTKSDITLTVPLLATKTTAVLVPANVSSYQVQISLLGLGLLPTTYTLLPSNGVFSPGVVYTLVVK